MLKDNERVVLGPKKMIVIPANHYCTVTNPLARCVPGKQAELRFGEQEIRFFGVSPFFLSFFRSSSCLLLSSSFLVAGLFFSSSSEPFWLCHRFRDILRLTPSNNHSLTPPSPQEPFALYPGEVLENEASNPITPLKEIPLHHAMRVTAIADFTDATGCVL